MAAQREQLAGPAGTLEAVIEQGSETPAFIAIVCHPHPLFGGTMDNKVVTTLTRLVRDRGGVVVRFNFRGVGESQGAYSDGIGETEDLLAVHSWLRQQWPGLPLWLAGFSFGSFVAARGAEILCANGEPVDNLLLVAPPVHHYPFTDIEKTGCPVTVVQGEDDEVVPAEQVYQWAGATPLQPDLIRFPECGHFFHGRLVELKEAAASHLPA
ncbi:MAG: alpha/beta fold hydrolase [Pseudomonadota bacterium]|uniref:alpha/beta hydrolase n=1 Tax=Alcanivorax sp. TaxID=1872427 RepID=UPI0025BAD44E|nr:alpha/beta fold hydrolase [Alcanivorax sp.]MEE3322176.1 alpha/beta fold hydrolase [Pseudomonadota bacterium]